LVRGVANIFEGTLTAVTPDTLAVTLRDGSSFAFSSGQLELAQVRVARRNTLRGAIVGGGVGLALGVALVVTDEEAGISQPTAPADEFGASFDTWKLIAPPIAGAALGAVVGRFVRTGRWVPGVVPGAGVGPGDFAFAWSVPVQW